MSFQKCHIAEVGTNSDDYLSQKVENRGQAKYSMSSSSLREFAECPKRWRDGYERPDSDALDYGSLLDILALTPERFEQRYIIKPETYSKTVMECPVCGNQSDSASCKKCKCERVKKIIEKPWNNNEGSCSEWIEEQAKKRLTVVSKGELTEASIAVSRLKGDEILNAYLEGSEKQVWLRGIWHDEATGLDIPTQCLIDAVPRVDTEFSLTIGDLKTTKNASPSAFQSWALKAGYHVQGSWNLDMWNNATGQARNIFCLLLSENFPPYQTARRKMTDYKEDSTIFSIYYGRKFYEYHMAKYARCLKTGIWPDYDEAQVDPNLDSQGWKEIPALPRLEYEMQSLAMEQEQAEQLETANDSDVPS